MSSPKIVPPQLPLVFPATVDGGGDGCAATRLVLAPDGAGGLPLAAWVGTGAIGPADAAALATLATAGRARALLPEHRRTDLGRPGLVGHRLGGSGAEPEAPDAGLPAAGRDWSTFLRTVAVEVDERELVITAADETAGLRLRTEVQALPGGSLRARHVVTNTGTDAYVVDALEVAFPVPAHHTEVLDFTGRWGRERVPQRHVLGDGTWTRENRGGRPGHDAPTVTVVGTPGLTFDAGAVLAVHVAWSGNTVVRVDRSSAEPTTLSGGELLLPGEVVLAAEQEYATPWVHVVAADAGLDDVAAAFHTYERSLPAHPRGPRPVNLNVWEAVYFDHDLPRLRELAALAADLGVERFVLDDGWFRHRRADTAGLGDWFVDEQVWPDGLTPLVEAVTGHGMTFGLWFEPEMVNPDSDLFREHPDWALAVPGRLPELYRHQLVLDLSRPEVVALLTERMDALLARYEISYVKWDHNRPLVEAGSLSRAGAAAVHAHTLGFERLLDTLARRHPGVEWESCASGGGRVDLDVLSRTQRVWTSDMTDARARQGIQRWTTQLVAPEYLGAHISAPRSHQSGRDLSLDFRAATALFGHFGIEWDLSQADAGERAALAAWIDLYKQHRQLLHTGRVVRVDEADEALWTHGVVAGDRRSALMARVQLDESARILPAPVRVPGLDPRAHYRVRWAGPLPQPAMATGELRPRRAGGPIGEETISGLALGRVGVPVPLTLPDAITLLEITAI